MSDETETEAKPKSDHHHHHLPEETRQHLRAAHAELHKSVESLLPPGFVSHRRAARREMLLAARGLIDHVLKRLEPRD